MKEMVESIKAHGVLMPGMVRPRAEGGYELIAGHRRKRACELAGLKTMPVIIKEYTNDEAIILMVDSNIQREDVLPSERAKAYAMKYEAMKHQGRSGGGRTLEEMAEAAGESGKTIQRYIQLSHLSDELLDKVDKKELPLTSAMTISSLPKGVQGELNKVIDELNTTVTTAQAARLKESNSSEKLTIGKIREILSGKKPRSRRLLMKSDKLDEYFGPDFDAGAIEKVILHLLDVWKKDGSPKLDSQD